MTRVKRGVISLKRRRNILKQVKGFRHSRKSKERMVPEKPCFTPDCTPSTTGGRKKKYESLVASKDKRRFQNKRYFLQQTYKQFQKANVQVDRKILAQLAEHQPNIFSKIVASVK